MSNLTENSILIETKSNDTFSLDCVKNDFPILEKTMNNQRLAYLDNAATTQKPSIVIETIDDYFATLNFDADSIKP